MSEASGPLLEERVENNGERVSPNKRDYNFHIHEDVYLYASRFASGKVVVDFGSGTGYGSSLLAETGAAQVLGFEYSEEAVIFSRRTFPNTRLTFTQADLNLRLSIAERADLVFSSNVFEHLVDVRQALQNALNILKPGGVFFLAVPAIQEDPRLEAEIRNRFHTSNFSIRFWGQTLKRCFGSIEARLQSLLCPYDVYLTLPESERGKIARELSCFISIQDDVQYGDLRAFPFSYANVVFLCRKPYLKAELADFRLCRVSHTRRLVRDTDALVGWSELLGNNDSLREELPFNGWLGGIELSVEKPGMQSSGQVELQISVEEAGSIVSKRSKLFQLFDFNYTPIQLHWNLYREPLFVAQGQRLFVSIRALAEQTNDVFKVALGPPGSDSKPRLYCRVYGLLAPIP